MTFDATERVPDDGNVETLRTGYPHPLTLHAETLIDNLEHSLAFSRAMMNKAENDLAVLKRIMGR